MEQILSGLNVAFNDAGCMQDQEIIEAGYNILEVNMVKQTDKNINKRLNSY